ncbi:hypothetical protein MXB_1379 [Myxobolus squamalis]|nr:hypothetical protein MXB_1379 [Myxobolus squamalis]
MIISTRRLLSQFFRAISSIKKCPITLTNPCINKLMHCLSEKEYFRITVEPGGCNGFQYKFGVYNEKNDDD